MDGKGVGMTDKALGDVLDEISQAFSGFALTTWEAHDSLCVGMQPFFENLKRDYPEAFDEDGTLRDDWIFIVGHPKT